MKFLGGILVLLLIGLGFHFFRICSDRFMLLRHAKSFTPYWWGIGGILSLMLITLAVFAGIFLLLGAFH
jgi:hypothetical protein